MAQVELVMPKMGESIMEATILKWLKNVGDSVEMDEAVLEIATDKVDSEVPSPNEGVISEILFKEGETVEIGKVIAIINTGGEEVGATSAPEAAKVVVETVQVAEPVAPVATVAAAAPVATMEKPASSNGAGRFYSPLVLNIARSEQVSMSVLEALPGTGKNNRLTKKDILAYISTRGQEVTPVAKAAPVSTPVSIEAKAPETKVAKASKSYGENVEVVEMDRMRKLIAKHMIHSKQTSAHVTSFVEADVTNLVNWRNKVKSEFQKRENQKITFTPIFIEAIVKAIKEFPMVNSSVDGDNVIIKKDINIGMAAALPSGNLIVPVIKHADRKNLVGLATDVNDLVYKARNNKLSPGDIEGGTFTLSNVGTFGNLMGTPIINQPQVAIMAVGSIKKKPVVIETEDGDVIGIRQMMFLSLSYDHRIVDGFLGGSFLRRVADYLEQFDASREI